MRRHWQPIRLLFACLLLGLAALVYLYWPMQARWRVPHNHSIVVGFQEKTFHPITISFPDPLLKILNLQDSYLILDGPEKQEIDLSVSSMDSADGSIHSLYKSRCCSAVPISFQLSHTGNVLAFVQEDIRLVDLSTQATILHLHDVPKYAGVAFSQDDRYLAVVTLNQIQVWDIQSQRCCYEFDSPKPFPVPDNNQLPTGFAGIVQVESNLIRFNKSSSLLAVCLENGLGVYDLNQNRVIGEMACDGIPRFAADRTLAIVRRGLVPTKPVQACYQISDKGIDTIFEDTTQYFSSHAGLTLTDTHYLTTYDLSKKEPWPSWFPECAKEFLSTYLPTVTPAWLISLRSLQNGMEEKAITFPITKKNSGCVCGFFSMEPISFFQAKLSQNNNWLLLTDQEAFELWPLCTSWRPMNCWLSIILLAFCALYLGVPSLRSMIACS